MEHIHFYIIIVVVTLFATYQYRKAAKSDELIVAAHTMLDRLRACTVNLDANNLMVELNRTIGKAYGYDYVIEHDDVDWFKILICDYKKRTTEGVLTAPVSVWTKNTPDRKKFVYLTLLGYFEGITKEKYLYDNVLLDFAFYEKDGKKRYRLTNFGIVAYRAYLAVATYAYNAGYDTTSDLKEIKECVEANTVSIMNDIEEVEEKVDWNNVQINFKQPKGGNK